MSELPAEDRPPAPSADSAAVSRPRSSLRESAATRSFAFLAAAIVLSVDGVLAWWAIGYAVRVLVAVWLWMMIERVSRGRGEELLPAPSYVPGSGCVRHLSRVLLLVGTFAVLGTLALRFLAPGTLDRALVIGDLEDLPGYLIAGAIVAPIVEEYVYRGLAYPLLRVATGAPIAIVVTAVLFWMLHWIYFREVSPVNHLFAGLLLGWSRERTGSLFAPTVLHAIGNLALLALDAIRLQAPDAFRSWISG